MRHLSMPTDADDRAEHWNRVLAIVDGFQPAPEVRAYALRAMDVEEAAAWRERVDKATPWREQIAQVRCALEGLGASAWVKIREHGRAHGLAIPGQLSEFMAALIPETPPPPAPHRHRPHARLPRDLARGVVRAWMELTGEFPPIAREGQGLFFDLVHHAFGAAGLQGAAIRGGDVQNQCKNATSSRHYLGS
jgi:hypothetical protein